MFINDILTKGETMNLLASFIQDWFLAIKTSVHDLRTNNNVLFITIVVLLSVSILLSMRTVVKRVFNVNAIKKNFVLPIIIAILATAILILLCTI